MWLGVWARRRGEPRWVAFRKRYLEYHPDDCVTICVNHHAEIHAIYDAIIQQDIAFNAKSLSKYSWEEADRLMHKLEVACRKWEQRESPGINTKKYSVWKNKRRKKK